MIRSYHKLKFKEIEFNLEKQEERLRLAEEVLKTKEIKKALTDQQVATDKIEKNLARIKGMKRSELVPRDSQIFLTNFAPIIVLEKGENVIKLARYRCNPLDKPAPIDIK